MVSGSRDSPLWHSGQLEEESERMELLPGGALAYLLDLKLV
jgi:hypothetical protein